MDEETHRKQFIENVQKWVSIDTQIKNANEKIKKAREMKSQIMTNIYEYVDNKSLQDTKIEISDGELRFFEKREYQPISFGYVEDCLDKIIADKKQVEYIMNYLHENREVKLSKDIRRNYSNKVTKA
jgi:hypothetical protein